MNIHSDKTVCDFFDPTADPKRQHRTTTVTTTQEGMESTLRPLKGRCRVAFEVGTQAQWVARIKRFGNRRQFAGYFGPPPRKSCFGVPVDDPGGLKNDRVGFKHVLLDGDVRCCRIKVTGCTGGARGARLALLVRDRLEENGPAPYEPPVPRTAADRGRYGEHE